MSFPTLGILKLEEWGDMKKTYILINLKDQYMARFNILTHNSCEEIYSNLVYSYKW